MIPYYEANGITIYHGDCLEVMPTLAPQSVDAIICDPPYGTTACKWDSVIPFEPMWAGIKRVLKPRGACVLFGSQPFTSALVMSNVKMFKYTWVWDKVNLFTNQMNAARQPMRQHEDICIFAVDTITYNPQYRQGRPYKTQRSGTIGVYSISPIDGVNATGMMHPGTVLQIPGRNPKEQGLHPTQKPLALMEYLVKTYTNEGDRILDFTSGSGTTLRAAKNLKRRAVGIEQLAHYCDGTVKRLEPAFEAALIDNGATLDDLPMFATQELE